MGFVTFPAGDEVMATESGADGDLVTLTIRLIRSFELRNLKFLVLVTIS